MRVLRRLEGGRWASYVEFPESALVERDLIRLDDQTLQTIRLRPAGSLSSRLPDLLIRGDLTEDGSAWKLRRSSGRRTELVAWPLDEPLQFSVLADGRSAQEVSISGRELPGANRPVAGIWVGRDKSTNTPDRLDLLGDGRVATSASKVFVHAAKDAEIQCHDGLELIESMGFGEHVLHCIDHASDALVSVGASQTGHRWRTVSWLISTLGSSSSSMTFRSESGSLTYSITAGRMISGLVLTQRIGLFLVI